jgi:hypothetical protein
MEYMALMRDPVLNPFGKDGLEKRKVAFSKASATFKEPTLGFY